MFQTCLRPTGKDEFPRGRIVAELSAASAFSIGMGEKTYYVGGVALADNTQSSGKKLVLRKRLSGLFSCTLERQGTRKRLNGHSLPWRVCRLGFEQMQVGYRQATRISANRCRKLLRLGRRADPSEIHCHRRLCFSLVAVALSTNHANARAEQIYVTNANNNSTIGEYTTSGATVNARLVQDWTTRLPSRCREATCLSRATSRVSATTSGATVNASLVTGLYEVLRHRGVGK